MFETPGGESKSATSIWVEETILTEVEGGMKVRRFMDGDKMIIELTTPKGATMKRTHSKQ